MTDKEIDDYILLNYKNMKNEDLAKATGVSNMTISRKVQKLGLTKRMYQALEYLDEEWRDAEGFPGYKVSNYANIENSRGMTIHQELNPEGYMQVKMVNEDGKRKTNRSHTIVAKAFIPNDNPEVKNQVNHIDGIKNHNSSDNLEWCSGSENIRHASANGFGATPNSYSDDTVRAICQELEKGTPMAEISRNLDINYRYCRFIKDRKIRTNISNDYKF